MNKLTPIILLLLTAITSSQSYAEFSSLPLAQSSSGTLYIHGKLDGSIDTELLVDTGSGYVSLSDKTFKQLEASPTTIFKRYITGVLANGKAVRVPVYQVAELTLANVCVLHDIEVTVMPNTDRDILGLNALRVMQPISIQLDPPELTASCSTPRLISSSSL